MKSTSTKRKYIYCGKVQINKNKLELQNLERVMIRISVHVEARIDI
jgi:hypothetical protein